MSRHAMSMGAAPASGHDLFAGDPMAVPSAAESSALPVLAPSFGGAADSRDALMERQRQLAQEKAKQRMNMSITMAGGDGSLLGTPGSTSGGARTSFARGAPMMSGPSASFSGAPSLLGLNTGSSLGLRTHSIDPSAFGPGGALGRPESSGSIFGSTAPPSGPDSRPPISGVHGGSLLGAKPASSATGAAAYVGGDAGLLGSVPASAGGCGGVTSPSLSDALRERERRAQHEGGPGSAFTAVGAGGAGAMPAGPLSLGGGAGSAAAAAAGGGGKQYAPISPIVVGGLPGGPGVVAGAPLRSGSAFSEGADAGGGAAALDLSDLRRFLTTPVPRAAGVVQCYIDREKGGFTGRMYPSYLLHLKDGDRFLLASKKRAGNKTSNYLVSMDKRDLNRDSDSFLGKVRSNYFGTEFVAYDDGVAPDAKKGGAAPAAGGKAGSGSGSGEGGGLRRELAVVTYAPNVLSSRGPRKMKVAVPRVSADGTAALFQPEREADSMLEQLKAGHTAEMVTMINKQPKWNDTVGAYVLNFNGRVTMASVKNFQLVSPEDDETVLLQFGRTDKDRFTMDIQWPLSPLAAFAITLSSFDYKLACE